MRDGQSADQPVQILPVILCGGSGVRLWPLSRDSYPKQFIALLDDRSTYQDTLERIEGVPFLRPLVIANHAVRFIAAEQAAQMGRPVRIVLEPEGRDSAAAIAVAALWGQRNAPDAVILALAADHVVQDVPVFRAACIAAARHASNGRIMTLGITPDHPATGYGYIQPGETLEGEGAARSVTRFVEKPEAAVAAGYVADGYLWNSGNFLFRPDDMVAALETHAPAVLAAARAALDAAATDLDFVRLDAKAFAAAPKISIDYAVMEKTSGVGVVPMAAGWSDVGTWEAVWAITPQDADGNAVRGRARLSNARRSYVHSEDRLTVLVGLDDVMVVATPDATLVAARGSADELRRLVADLKRQGMPEADAHRRMHTPWGWWEPMDMGDRFKVKRISVKPGGRLSLQKHFHRAEHWVVVRGTAEVTVAGRVSLLGENEAAYIPIGAEHRLANPGRIPLEIVEVQVGPYTGEDDIVRIEDVYGR